MPVTLPPGRAKARDEPSRDRIEVAEHHDRDGGGCVAHGAIGGRTDGNHDVRLPLHQLACESRQRRAVAIGESLIDNEILALDIAQLVEGGPETSVVLG